MAVPVELSGKRITVGADLHTGDTLSGKVEITHKNVVVTRRLTDLEPIVKIRDLSVEIDLRILPVLTALRCRSLVVCRVDLIGDAGVQIFSGEALRIAYPYTDHIHSVFNILVENLRCQPVKGDSGDLLQVVASIVEEKLCIPVCLTHHTAADVIRHIGTRSRRKGDILLTGRHAVIHLYLRIVSAGELALDLELIRVLKDPLVPDAVPESLYQCGGTEILRILRLILLGDMVEICGPSGSVIGPHRGSAFVVDLICGLLVIFVSIIVIIANKEAVPDGTAVAAYDSGCPVHVP